MSDQARLIAFILAASKHGPMIVNRLDYYMQAPKQGFGVGFQILQNGRYGEIRLTSQLPR